jgi:hypothetical protein
MPRKAPVCTALFWPRDDQDASVFDYLVLGKLQAAWPADRA